jgi:hypothetical protein
MHSKVSFSTSTVDLESPLVGAFCYERQFKSQSLISSRNIGSAGVLDKLLFLKRTKLLAKHMTGALLLLQVMKLNYHKRRPLFFVSFLTLPSSTTFTPYSLVKKITYYFVLRLTQSHAHSSLLRMYKRAMTYEIHKNTGQIPEKS